MSDRPREIQIKGWDRFQHYKKRNPPWIRLYRDLLDDPEYRALSDPAGRLLFELWLLASEFHPGGRVPYDVGLLAWRTGRSSEAASTIASTLRELDAAGFIVLPDARASTTASADASTSTRQRQRQRTEAEADSDPSLRSGSGAGAVVENSDERRRGELIALARELGGRQAMAGRNATVIDQMRRRGKPWEEIESAIRGLRFLIDQGALSSWSEQPIPPGGEFDLRVLNNQKLGIDYGDGPVGRPMWDVAVEVWEESQDLASASPTPLPSRGGELERVRVDPLHVPTTRPSSSREREQKYA